jgi:hypothetical protein
MVKKKDTTEVQEEVQTKEKFFFPDFGEIEAENMEEAQKIYLDSKK